jgi:hypothetical protein
MTAATCGVEAEVAAGSVILCHCNLVPEHVRTGRRGARVIIEWAFTGSNTPEQELGTIRRASRSLTDSHEISWLTRCRSQDSRHSSDCYRAQPPRPARDVRAIANLPRQPDRAGLGGGQVCPAW